jgi:hypothetical protein
VHGAGSANEQFGFSKADSQFLTFVLSDVNNGLLVSFYVYLGTNNQSVSGERLTSVSLRRKTIRLRYSLLANCNLNFDLR